VDGKPQHHGGAIGNNLPAAVANHRLVVHQTGALGVRSGNNDCSPEEGGNQLFHIQVLGYLLKAQNGTCAL
jgi:hypothetical protein